MGLTSTVTICKRSAPRFDILAILFSILFSIFFRPSFFSFSYLFAAVIDLLPDLLPLQEILRKHSWDGQLWVCQSNFWALSCIFQASLSQSHLTWVSLERFFLLQRLGVVTMMPFLVKDDGIRSGTKAKAKCKKVVDEAPCTGKACCFSLDSSHCWENVLVLNTCRYILIIIQVYQVIFKCFCRSIGCPVACYWHPDWGHCPFPDHFLCRAKEEEKGKRCEMSEISLF